MRSAVVEFPGMNRKRRSDAPTAHVARIGWMLITLLCEETLDYGVCRDLFGVSVRQFQRDVCKIRNMGRPHGFAVSPGKGGRVFLSTPNRRVSKLTAKNREAVAALARLAAAFGGPIASEMRGAMGDEVVDDSIGFLQVCEPQPSANQRVTLAFEDLKLAAASAARVEFVYSPARGARARRRVEPYRIVARSGRYYLVAYDLARRDWRYFALDAIEGAISRAGSFSPRSLPERFLSAPAVGWIRGARGGDVTICVSSLIAAAVGARTWQEGQRFSRDADGDGHLTLRFDDLAEAVRFSLSFGTEATIIAPPEAVELARETAGTIVASYRAGVGRERRLTGLTG